MGVFRRVLRMEPIRANVSHPGVGLSAGIRGARVAIGPRGTYVSLSSGGFHYRQKSSDASSTPAQLPSRTPTPSGYSTSGFITTASVDSLQQLSPDEVAREIESRAAAFDWFKAYWVGGLVFVLLVLTSAGVGGACAIALVLVVAGFPVRNWSEERRIARLIYDVDDSAAMERFALASAAGEALAHSAGVWHVYYSAPNADARRNAGATTLLRRTPTSCVRGTHAGVETNLEPWTIPAGPQQLLFLPDRLFLWENGRVAALPYEQLTATAAETRFIEEGPAPRDGEVIATTWRFVCKDGTPDLRFKDNYQIPVLRYGELTISSPTGLRLVFQLSRPESAFRAAQALNVLSTMARRASEVAQAPVPAAASPTRGVRRPAPPLAGTPTPPYVAPASAPPTQPAVARPAPQPVPADQPAARVSTAPAYSPSPFSSSSPRQSWQGPIAPPLLSAPPAPWAPPAPPMPPARPVTKGGTVAMSAISEPSQREPWPRSAVSSVARVAPITAPAQLPVPPAPVEPPRSIAIERPSAGRDPWIHPGGSAVIAGYQLDGGMIYVGEGLPPVGTLLNIEPALINPRLQVDSANVNRSGAGMQYWPSYSDIGPAERAAYLEWLAGGRRDPGAYIGYVFLYFYGLERRALADAQRGGLAGGEREAIYAEVERLLTIYSRSNSFRGYATEFLAAMWMGTSDRVYERCAPPTAPAGGDFPLLLKLGLGQLARDARPIPADWALAWVLCDPEARLTTPVRRCPEELRELFRIRYHQAFGEGMNQKPGNKDLVVHYRPASASFGGVLRLTAPAVSDVTGRRKAAEKLRQVVEQCAIELDPFSRWIGRNPDQRGSVTAAGLLPPELLAMHQGQEVIALVGMIEGHLDGKQAALVPAAELLRGRHAKAEVVALLQLLQKKGYGVEPDVRFGGEIPSAEGRIVVFRIGDGAPTAASTHYRAVTLLMHLAVALAAADGEISEAEEKQLEARLDAMAELSPPERLRLSAHVRWLVHERPGIAGVKKRIAALSAEQRVAVADFLVAMAGADGRVDPGEVKLLTKLFPTLGLEASEVYRRIHVLASAKASPAMDAVTVQAEETSKGYPVPPPPKSSGGSIALNMASVQAKLAETSAVAALLGSIFVEEEQAQPSKAVSTNGDYAPGEAQAKTSAPPVRNLNATHSAFVRKLAERAEWTRAEVEALAAGLGLLTDGALEVVNDAAFEVCGSPVWSGDDLIEVDADVMKELCA
ncbi:MULTISPECIES: TerB N-terminal domain-containing protein [Sorangium]|uniref:TerB N-terminal domain-containing protein n=1 Tax=Sorangium TaxID=39643 RepID=UPI003D9C134E